MMNRQHRCFLKHILHDRFPHRGIDPCRHHTTTARKKCIGYYTASSGAFKANNATSSLLTLSIEITHSRSWSPTLTSGTSSTLRISLVVPHPPPGTKVAWAEDPDDEAETPIVSNKLTLIMTSIATTTIIISAGPLMVASRPTSQTRAPFVNCFVP